MSEQSQDSKPTARLPFKLPTRQELEERRKQLESSKVELHFKPKGITLDPSHSSSTSSASVDSNATNSAHNLPRPTNAAAVSNHAKPSSSHSTSEEVVDDFSDLGDIQLTDDLFDDSEETTGLSSTASAVPAPTAPEVLGAASTNNTLEGSKDSNAATDVTTSSTVAPPPFIPKSKSTIVVNPSQRGNPLLQHIRNVPYEFGQIEPDYMVGLTSCVLFLSIRYHRLHPEYIYSRIAAIGKSFMLRVLLVLVDVDTHQQAIRELTRVAVTSEFTLICCWSNEEAARYIETYKAYENKPPDAIRERVDNDYLSKLSDCLTQVRSINKTDVVTLSSTFGSFQSIVEASADEIGLLPGFGEQKVKRLIEAFNQPFVVDPHKRKRRRG
ncbi:Excision repair cross-complementation group 1 [Actinomortierella wolfii]|nr:Excision repair cross-complementation group 1 [Actinomortierella wolfii]